ncbi:hypothetical protein CASFOL_036656 [Castilleja foliolosa]|uniref:Peptidase A1 domain-containing protein n=1 Tax=Castilleja foliolosa TaxID=1961234 RepID=A0ABD3BNK9_9LAMI
MAFYYKPFSFSLYTIIAYFFASVYMLSWIEATKNGGITIDLIHRDSPLSPSYDPSKTRFERLKNAFKRSVSRKSSFKLSKTTSTYQNDLEAPIIPNGGEYLMKIGIGTPPVEFLGIADTGSDLTWIQCQPCTNCYKQKAPLFDTKKTSTYRTISCQSQTCSQVGTSSCDSKNVCEYQYSYGDNSYTIGDLSVETLTFDSSVSFSKVVFGCGHENTGTFGEAGSGLIGLGGGPLSIITQLDQSIGGKFSYCLALLDSNSSSKISFGANAIVTGPNVVSTPLVKKQPDTYYYLTLEGVSIGVNRVNNVFGSKASGSVEEGNIIIDSGTTLTFLPSSFYEGFESALVAAVKGKQVSDSQGTFKLCYEKSSNFSAPPVTAHFTGADVELTQESTFLEVEQDVLCLTFLPSENLAIFGNLHQMNYEIGYDIADQKVVFLPKDCSKSE